MLRVYFLRISSGILILASLLNANPVRVSSLAKQVKCDCGCGDILAECEHADCQRRPLLKQEISDAVLRGGSDDQILKQMAAAHGTAILVMPVFQGFNTLLWIVPVGMGLAVLAFAVYRFRKLGRRGAGE